MLFLINKKTPKLFWGWKGSPSSRPEKKATEIWTAKLKLEQGGVNKVQWGSIFNMNDLRLEHGDMT